MNIHKKLLQMGFTQCEPHRFEYNFSGDGKDSVVPDKFVRKKVFKNGKQILIESKKEHPKWNSFYFLEFADNLKVWIHLEKQTHIRQIWIEGDRVFSGAKIIYDGNTTINSKGDIIRLFPKDIQRDFIINSLFN